MTEPRIFDQAMYDRVTQDVLPAVPAAHSNAIVFALDKTGAKVGAHYEWSDERQQFELTAAYAHEWSGDDRVGIGGFYSWGAKGGK